MTDKKNDKPPFTHTAWILKTDLMIKGKRLGRWIDEGVARLNEQDGSFDAYLHSFPIGGFSGQICFRKIGAAPPDVPDAEPAPQRPGEPDSGAEADIPND